MFNFDVARYEKVLGDALALRPQIEVAADEICKAGYSNIFFNRQSIKQVEILKNKT